LKPDGKGWLDRPANVTRLWRWLLALGAALAALDLLALVGVWDRHTSIGLEELPGFYAMWGFVGIVVLIVLAKALRRLVMRRENYYDRAD
jgi:hypothetical protein